MQELRGTGGLWIRDVFEYPDGEPSELFINPFACPIDPFMWRELQVQLCCDLSSVLEVVACSDDAKALL